MYNRGPRKTFLNCFKTTVKKIVDKSDKMLTAAIKLNKVIKNK